mmetsp:Transcript_10656/g.15978  ORF Transcript_10656/g.15978 Transcript_10656/m.15978 type:complete len:258 (+) Transcript_10656:509-1282(+)
MASCVSNRIRSAAMLRLASDICERADLCERLLSRLPRLPTLSLELRCLLCDLDLRRLLRDVPLFVDRLERIERCDLSPFEAFDRLDLPPRDSISAETMRGPRVSVTASNNHGFSPSPSIDSASEVQVGLSSSMLTLLRLLRRLDFFFINRFLELTYFCFSISLAALSAPAFPPAAAASTAAFIAACMSLSFALAFSSSSVSISEGDLRPAARDGECVGDPLRLSDEEELTRVGGLGGIAIAIGLFLWTLLVGDACGD